MTYIIRGITVSDSSTNFDCGEAQLNRYFSKFALINDQKNIARAFVVEVESGIVGYYTLSMTSVESKELQPFLGKLPAYPIPVALIGRFATDSRVQGQGFGGTLLFDAFARTIQSTSGVAAAGIIVDAKHSKAKSFYEHFQFKALGEDTWPRRMFIALASVEDALKNK